MTGKIHSCLITYYMLNNQYYLRWGLAQAAMKSLWAMAQWTRVVFLCTRVSMYAHHKGRGSRVMATHGTYVQLVKDTVWRGLVASSGTAAHCNQPALLVSFITKGANGPFQSHHWFWPFWTTVKRHDTVNLLCCCSDLKGWIHGNENRIVMERIPGLFT